MASTTTQKQAWGNEDRTRWFQSQKHLRSYREDVLSKLEKLSADKFDVVKYGALSIDESKYPLFVVKTKGFESHKGSVLITGGVHGYETSGVAGAIEFIETQALKYSKDFNIVIAPCISPWAYETINRWNNKAVDPNRNFIKDGAEETEEAKLLMDYLSHLGLNFIAHIDCHETTDTDETVFGPTKAERDGTDYEPSIIPDGFYLCGDSNKPELDFQTACLDGVRKVTHIAPADIEGMIIGTPVAAEGVILYPVDELGLCISMTNAKYRTTTEVYPDSPNATPEICNKAQVACICGGLDFVILHK